MKWLIRLVPFFRRRHEARMSLLALEQQKLAKQARDKKTVEALRRSFELAGDDFTTKNGRVREALKEVGAGLACIYSPEFLRLTAERNAAYKKRMDYFTVLMKCHNEGVDAALLWKLQNGGAL